MSRYQNRYDNAYYNHLDGGPRKKAGGSIFLVVVLLFLTMGGIFNIKDAVVYVSASLGISKNTVYLHLRNLKHELPS